ncbi:MAG: TIM barrel protein [Candidatus Omnitrophota bacterium]
MNIKLGFDLNCFGNRYMEPEAWTDVVASCGIHIIQFNFDVIDFLLPAKIQKKLVEKTLASCRKNNIRIKCAFGGHNHHQNYLGHPDDEAAKAYETFYRQMADLTAGLGAEGFGTCFAILTVNANRDRKRRKEILLRAIESYHRLADYGKKLGLKYLLYETTSTPRETGATFEENDWLLSRMKGSAIPMLLCLDVGHRNQENPGAPEADPYAWIERYGKVSPLIHIQQSNNQGSFHWPFVPEYNNKGDVQPEKVLAALRRSEAKHEILLALEIRHRAYYPEECHLEHNLRESVKYWRHWVKGRDVP